MTLLIFLQRLCKYIILTMNNSTIANQNGVVEKQVCPVCSTAHETAVTHCTTCAWYFPLQHTPQYALELSRAKQQFQMVSTFNQVLQGLQVQSKMLEQISFRMDGLEGEVNQLKEKQVAEPPTLLEYDYPVLAPIKKAADFNRVDKRLVWWNSLEEQWQKAYNQGVLQKANDYQPTDEELDYILTSPTLRLVGPRAMHPNIDFELTNLSGVKHLTDLTLLVVSHNGLTDLAGIEHLENLLGLFVNSNKLTHIKEVHYLPQLTQLYVNVNQLKDIQPVTELTNLTALYCCYNRLIHFGGITAAHADKLTAFTALPNDNIPLDEIKRLEQLGIACKKA